MQIRTEFKERLRRLRDWNAAIDELESELDDNVKDVEQLSELLYDLGKLTEEVVPERDRALAIYQRAWKIFPDNVKALSRAREVYHELGRLEMVAKVGELQLKSATTDDETAMLSALVGVAYLDSGNRDRAIPLLRTALKLEPDATHIRDALAAAEYDADMWQDTVERLQTEAERADSDTASRMLLRAARITRMESDDLRAYEALLRRVLHLDAQNESANYALDVLLSSQDRWEELESHHEQRAYAAADDATRAALYRRFALEWVQRFKKRERAAKFFALAMEAVEQNGAPALQSQIAGFTLVREIFGGRREWARVLELTDRVLPKLDDERKLHLALHAALIAWHEVDDVDRARHYFDMVSAIEPSAPELAEFEAAVGSLPGPGSVPVVNQIVEASDLARAPEVQGASDAVAYADLEITRDAADVEPAPAPRPAPARRPAPIVPLVVGDEAIGEDQGALIDEARQLEASGEASPDKIIDAWRKAIAKDPDKRTPRRALAAVLRHNERWNALIEALKDEEAKACGSASQKIPVLHEMVDVYRDHLRLDVMVVNTLNQILEQDPADIEVLDTLAAQYESMKRWPDLVGTLQKRALHAADDAERVQIYLRVASLYIEKFSNQAEAIKAFEQVLELDPDNREASVHLQEVYEKRRDWEKLIRLRDRDIERTTDAAERASKTLEVAQMAATRLKKPAVCIEWWERVRAFEPAHPEALSELEKFYERDKNWDKLAEICQVKATESHDSKDKADALQKLGQLYQDKLEDPKKAIGAWQQLLAVDPEHRRAQDALKKLYIADQSWDELEQFYRGQDKLAEYVRVIERQVDEAPSA